MSIYLLDTNIVSELIKNPFGIVRARIDHVGADNVFMSVIVAGELQIGVINRGSQRLRERVYEAFTYIPVWPLPINVSEFYGPLRYDLNQRGLPISANDMWIAAHALAEDAVLVTNNIREFSRIANLKVENWMQSE